MSVYKYDFEYEYEFQLSVINGLIDLNSLMDQIPLMILIPKINIKTSVYCVRVPSGGCSAKRQQSFSVEIPKKYSPVNHWKFCINDG